MAWQTPKTNWVSTDSITASDWNRMSGNADHIQHLAEQWFDIEQTYTPVVKESNEWSYASEWNDLCEAIWYVSDKLMFTYADMPVYYPNGPTPTATDLNTIEGLEATIFDAMRNVRFNGRMMLEAQLEGRL